VFDCVIVCYSFMAELQQLILQILQPNCSRDTSESELGILFPYIGLHGCVRPSKAVIKCTLGCEVRQCCCWLAGKGHHHEVNNSIAFQCETRPETIVSTNIIYVIKCKKCTVKQNKLSPCCISPAANSPDGLGAPLTKECDISIFLSWSS